MHDRSLLTGATLAGFLGAALAAQAGVRHTYEHAANMAALPISISDTDLINGLLPLRNVELSAGYPTNTNGYVPISNMGEPCAAPPLISPNTDLTGFYTGNCPGLELTGAKLTDGQVGAGCDSVLTDFAWPSAVFQFDLDAKAPAGPKDIGEIRVFAANQDGRVFQNYDVYVSTDPNADTKERVFTLLVERVITSHVVCAGPSGGDGFFPNVNDGSQVPAIGATATRVFDDESETLAAGVTSIRLVFWAVSNTQRVFRDQWLGPMGCPLVTPEQVEVRDADGFQRAFEATVIKEIDVLAVRSGAFEICDNGVDDDGDLAVDGDDPDCFGQTCPPEDCANGIDDNGDSLVDCNDPDCRNVAICLTPEDCSNGIDDNGNGFVDCDDATCAESSACLPCNDPFADYDADGDVDQSDFGLFQTCYTGPTVGLPEPAGLNCHCFDRNDDRVINESDYAAFLNCVSGPDVPASAGCDD